MIAYRQIPYINGYKMVLTIVVIIGHFYNYIGGRTVWQIRLIGGAGAKAVDAFLYISGFLLIWSTYGKEKSDDKWGGNIRCGLMAYYMRKWKRLYPAYFFAIIIAIISQPLFSRIQRDVLIHLTGEVVGAFDSPALILGFPNICDVLAHLFMLQGVFYKYNCTILGPAWYMGTEWICILASPFLLTLFFNKNRKKLYDFLLLLLFQAGGFLISRNGDMQQHIVRNLPVYIAGMLYAKYIVKNDKGGICALKCNIGIYLLLLNPAQNWLSCFFIFIFTILIENRDKNKKDSKLGEISHYTYQLYLLHMIAIPVGFGVSISFFSFTGLYLCICAGLLAILCLYLLVKAELLIEKNFANKM